MAGLTLAVGGDMTISRQMIFWGTATVIARDIKKPEPASKLLGDAKLTNIVDLSLSKGVIVLVATDSDHDATQGLSLFTYDLAGKVLKHVKQIKGLQRAALAKQGDSIALTVCGESGCSLQVLDRATGRTETIVPNVVDRVGGASWNKAGDQLAYGTETGEIRVRSLVTGKDSFVAQGTAPAWSPNSDAIAFLREKSLKIYDLKTSKELAVTTRWFWQSRFLGPIYWSSDGASLAVNAPAGLAGYEYKCIVLNTAAWDKQEYDSGFERCGPWL
jgi:WD40 repeat protein